MPWYVLYTRPRNEKKTAKVLESKGVKVYCPTTEVVKQWSDRKKTIIEPVFKSYIFVCLKNYELDQVEVLNTAGAVRFLWWIGKPGVVKTEEIEAIEDFLNEYKGSTITADIYEGQEVAITEGPLKKQSGTIKKIKGNKAYLELTSLGWNILAEVPIHKLEKQHHG
jgi:transcription antitermination factor NusG